MTTSAIDLGSVQTFLDAHQARFVDELIDFLRIPSISRLPAHAGDMRRGAAWLEARIQQAGFEHVRAIPTFTDADGGQRVEGPPVVYGDWLHAGPGKPTLLLYGHYDVQPADPLDQWESPPFEPQVRDGRLYARGASDDKGNLLLTVLAAEALLETAGALPLNVKCLFEGQEEIGSQGLQDMVRRHPEYRDLFACDLVLCADAGACGDDPPGLVIGTRGGCGVRVEVRGAKADVHSGVYGGAVQNPFMALASIIASLRDPRGNILVEGFYDRVRPLSPEERALARNAPLTDESLAAQLDVPHLIGEAGYTVLERIGARPTLDVLRVWGEHEGTPVTPIIPRVAHASIACRLVPDQDPEEIKRLLAAHIERHAPPGVRVTVTTGPGGSRAYEVPFEHPANRAAVAALTEVTGTAPYVCRLGGSVPILNHLQRELGAYSILFGFMRDDEGFHAPNEFFRLASFRRGQLTTALLYAKLGELAPA